MPTGHRCLRFADHRAADHE